MLVVICLLVCSNGFTGLNCETSIDDCASNPCNNGTCADLVNGYSCTCQAGYTGTNCDTNVDECATNLCVNGTCTDLVNGYSCTCEAGYTGTNCDMPVPSGMVIMLITSHTLLMCSNTHIKHI